MPARARLGWHARPCSPILLRTSWARSGARGRCTPAKQTLGIKQAIEPARLGGGAVKQKMAAPQTAGITDRAARRETATVDRRARCAARRDPPVGFPGSPATGWTGCWGSPRLCGRYDALLSQISLYDGPAQRVSASSFLPPLSYSPCRMLRCGVGLLLLRGGAKRPPPVLSLSRPKAAFKHSARAPLRERVRVRARRRRVLQHAGRHRAEQGAGRHAKPRCSAGEKVNSLGYSSSLTEAVEHCYYGSVEGNGVQRNRRGERRGSKGVGM